MLLSNLAPTNKYTLRALKDKIHNLRETYQANITNQATKISYMEEFKSFDVAYKSQLLKIIKKVAWLTQANNVMDAKKEEFESWRRKKPTCKPI